jgi:ribonuclease-3
MRHKRNGKHNERLEYLGDAVLGAITAEYLYKKFPNHEEGSLTKMRSKLVNRLTLLQRGKEMGLDKFLVAEINVDIEGKYVISNMVEALVGAIYLDLGQQYTVHFVLDILLKDLLKSDIEHLEFDFKSRILEWGQKHRCSITFESRQIADEGVAIPMFFSEVFVDSRMAGNGVGYSKKESEQNAAKNVWKKERLKMD